MYGVTTPPYLFCVRSDDPDAVRPSLSPLGRPVLVELGYPGDDLLHLGHVVVRRAVRVLHLAALSRVERQRHDPRHVRQTARRVELVRATVEDRGDEAKDLHLRAVVDAQEDVQRTLARLRAVEVIVVMVQALQKGSEIWKSL